MHLSFTRTGHVLHPLGSPDDNYLICIAKIQCSSLFIATDANLKRLYLYDARRPYAQVRDEILGYHRNDLSIASVDLLDPGDGEDAVCGDVCVDDSGHDIYALIIKKDAAYIKVFKNLDRVLTYENQHYDIPKSDSPYVVIRNTTQPLKSLPMERCLGKPVIDSQFCYGSGLAYYNGVLYVLTRREVEYQIATLVRYDALAKSAVYHLRMADKRTASVRFSLLTTINAEAGVVISNTYLTQPAFGEDTQEDGILHGLSVYDGMLWSGRRWDINLLPSDLTLWHLSEGKTSIPSGAPMFESVEEAAGAIQGFVKYEYAVVDNGAPLTVTPAMMQATGPECASACVEFMRLAKSQSAAAVQQATPMQQSRGPTMIVAYDLSQIKPDNTKVPTFSVINNVFPFDISLPYSMTHDKAERKLYCVFGNQIWVFDCLDYTILVNHPGFSTMFEGDIIDMGDVLASNRQELQCFIRNDATFTMYGVTLHVEVTEDDPRTEDLFLTQPASPTGYKTLNLGDIPPGASREFGTRVYSMGVQSWEDKTTHTIPLRIYYDVQHDDF